MKFGRNDPCWCGSGRKYKHCHLDREAQPPVTIQDALERSRAVLRRKLCLHPIAPEDCGRVIAAHTIQRRRGLNHIARAGKVYSYLPTDAAAIERAGGRLPVRLVGIGVASTFNGFCDRHDDALFAPIEKRDLVISKETAFLFGYRALCRELCMKRASLDSLDLLRTVDRGRPMEFQIALQASVRNLEHHAQLTLRDLEAYKAEADQMLANGDFGGVHYFVLKFENTPDIALAAGWFPTHDFTDTTLQDLGREERPDLVFVCVQPERRGGLVIFTWWGDRPACLRLVRSMHHLPDSTMSDAVIRLATLCENVYLHPDWWEGLDEARRDVFCERLHMAADTSRGWPELAHDGVRFCDWGGVSRLTNLDDRSLP